ncbi:hypothetical protein MN0502_07330 [Arthrobacter sp. MN05-02]|nr:hypothetical protein MN0502_07330 [Arthrobacter sp. MN05-02]
MHEVAALHGVDLDFEFDVIEDVDLQHMAKEEAEGAQHPVLQTSGREGLRSLDDVPGMGA